MLIEEVVVDLRRSGYSCDQIRQYVQDMYGLDISLVRIRKLCLPLNADIIQYQNWGDKKWQRLADACPREEFESYFLPKKQYYDRKAICKKYGFNDTDYTHLLHLYKDKGPIEVFSITTTRLINEADNYSCRRCGYKEEVMYTYHIIPGGGNNFENGITLCKTCYRFMKWRKIVLKSFKTDRKRWKQFMRKHKINTTACQKRNKYIKEFGEEPK